MMRGENVPEPSRDLVSSSTVRNRELLDARQTTDPIQTRTQAALEANGADALLLLFAAHTVLNEFSHAARACTRSRSIAALSRKLTTSFLLSFEHIGVLAHDAGFFLRSKWESLTVFRECSR